MISDKEIVCPYNLLNVAHKKKGVKAGIVNAGKPLPMISVQDAVNENLMIQFLLGMRKKFLNVRKILNGIFQNLKLFMNL